MVLSRRFVINFTVVLGASGKQWDMGMEDRRGPVAAPRSPSSKGVDRRATVSAVRPVAVPRGPPPKGAAPHRRALTAGRRYPAQGRSQRRAAPPSKGVDRRATVSGVRPVAVPRGPPPKGAAPHRRALTAEGRYPAQGRSHDNAGRARTRAETGAIGAARAGCARDPGASDRPSKTSATDCAHAEDGSPATKFAAQTVAGQPRMGHERAKRRRQGNREEGRNCAAGPARPRLWYDGQKRWPAAAAGRRLTRKPRYMSLRYAAP